MRLMRLRSQKGFALISVYMAVAVISTVSTVTFTKSLAESRAVDREVARLRSFAAAEAAIQNAMAQIGVNAYTGFINTSNISVNNFQSTTGTAVGSYSATISYPNQADWVIVNASATVDGDTKNVEARIFLDSNLSKYLVYSNATTFSSGTNAQYGEPDLTDTYGDGTPDYPQYVPENEADRASLYFTGTWDVTGSNVHVYGDVNAQTQIEGNNASQVHGDTYSGAFSMNGSGTVTNSGVTGGLIVGDGFSDDLDRNNNGSVTVSDYPDYHDLTSAGGGDSHKFETITQIDTNFYKNNNSVTAFGGASATNRYLEFVPQNGGTTTQVRSYANSNFTGTVTTYSLPANAIVYVNGSAYVKGEIGGRVSVVTSNHIYFDGNLTYASGQTHADSGHSAAFMAKKQLFFRANNLTVSGILSAENSSNASAAFDGEYNTSGQYSPNTKSELNLYGNRIIKGSSNLSVYPDRVYGYDNNLKYYRPPGIPVQPSLRTVREE